MISALFTRLGKHKGTWSSQREQSKNRGLGTGHTSTIRRFQHDAEVLVDEEAIDLCASTNRHSMVEQT